MVCLPADRFLNFIEEEKEYTHTHSPKGLFGTPAQFHINAIIKSTNHIEVASIL